ncbi:hypothetical protein PTKIN_Ptkin08bG0076200 [Pterospermum kingtungense]
MEESSNGRLEETLKVQAHDEQKEVVVEDSAAPKPDVESVGDIAADRNSMPDGEDSSSSSSSADKEAESEERSPHVENSESFKEENVASDSVVESVDLEQGDSLTQEFSQDTEPSVETSGDSYVAKLDAKETKETISSPLDGANADAQKLVTGLKEETKTTTDSALLTDEKPKRIDKETTVMGLDDINGSTVAADVASKGTVETTISCLGGNGEVPATAVDQGITETKIPAQDNNVGGSSSGFPELISKENVPIVETRDAGELVVNNPQIHDSTGIDQPTVSLSHHPMQPTSWKSCCGLFEVLRRHSDR